MRILYSLLAFSFLILLSSCAVEQSYTTARIGQPAAWSRPLSPEPLEQSFLVPDGGADEIEIVAGLSPTGTVPSSLQWTISDNASGQRIAEGDFPSSSLGNNSPLRIPLGDHPERYGLTLSLTAPDGSLSLWTTDQDIYPEGALVNNLLAQDRDLVMTFRRYERPQELPAMLTSAVARWPRVPAWVVLLAVMPGWMIVAWLGDRRGRPLVPVVTAVGITLVPLMHAFLSLIGQRVYDPLSRSLLLASTLTTLLLLLRQPDRVRAILRTRWVEALLCLLVALVLSIATWLMATRGLLALPGTASVASAVAAREMMVRGSIVASSGSLPLASMASVLGLLSLSDPVDMTLLLALLLGVALVPSLFALGSEITRRPWGGVVLMPLAWLWPAPWNALAHGDLPALYSLALLPAGVALAVRAMTTPGRGLGILGIAALPLAGLALVQGVGAPLALAIALALALLLRWGRGPDDAPVPARRVLLRAWALLALMGIALLPALWYSYSITPLSQAGYLLLLVAVAIALLLRRAKRLGVPLAILAMLVIFPLAWQRSLPITPQGATLSHDAQRAMVQEHNADSAGMTAADSVFLVSMHRDGAEWVAEEGTVWLPVIVPRRTTLQLQREIEVATPGLLDQALSPGALDDGAVRAQLHRVGIRYLMLDSQGSTLHPEDIVGKAWAQTLYHVGTTYIFEILP